MSWAVSLWHKRAGVATSWSQPIRAQNLDNDSVPLFQGWGAVDPDELSASDVLRAVKVKVVDQKTCQAANTNQTITKAMICAGGNGKDSCPVIFPKQLAIFYIYFNVLRETLGGLWPTSLEDSTFSLEMSVLDNVVALKGYMGCMGGSLTSDPGLRRKWWSWRLRNIVIVVQMLKPLTIKIINQLELLRWHGHLLMFC